MPISTSLRANAVFTLLCALVCLTAADWVSFHTALPGRTWALVLGAALASYVPTLLFAASRPVAWLVKAIVVLDWSFVVIALAFLATRLGKVDAAGLGLMAGSAAAVSLFAILQMRALSLSKPEKWA